MKILYSDDTFPVGKYQGQLVSDIIQQDKAYIKQQAKQSSQFCFSDEVISKTSSQPLNNYIPRR